MSHDIKPSGGAPMRLLTLSAVALALSLSPALAEPKTGSKGGGAKEFAPGQLQKKPGQAKKYAPGQQQKKPGQAKKYAPGQQ
jgi:hypothetical protein